MPRFRFFVWDDAYGDERPMGWLVWSHSSATPSEADFQLESFPYLKSSQGVGRRNIKCCASYVSFPPVSNSNRIISNRSYSLSSTHTPSTCLIPMPACPHFSAGDPQHRHCVAINHLHLQDLIRPILDDIFRKHNIIPDIQHAVMPDGTQGIRIAPWAWTTDNRGKALSVLRIVQNSKSDALFGLPQCLCARNEVLRFLETRVSVGRHSARGPGDPAYQYLTCHTFDPHADRDLPANQGCGYWANLSAAFTKINEAGSLAAHVANVTQLVGRPLEWYFPFLDVGYMTFATLNAVNNANPEDPLEDPAPPYHPPLLTPASSQPTAPTPTAVATPSTSVATPTPSTSRKAPRVSLSASPSKSQHRCQEPSPSPSRRKLPSATPNPTPEKSKGKKKDTQPFAIPPALSDKFTELFLAMEDGQVLEGQLALLDQGGLPKLEFDHLFIICPCSLVFARRHIASHLSSHDDTPFHPQLAFSFDAVQPSDLLLAFDSEDGIGAATSSVVKTFLASDRADHEASGLVEGLSIADFQQAFCECDCTRVIERGLMPSHYDSPMCSHHYQGSLSPPAGAGATKDGATSSTA